MTIWSNHSKNICFSKYWSPKYQVFLVIFLLSLEWLTVPTIPASLKLFPWLSSLHAVWLTLIHHLPQRSLLYLLWLISFTWSWSAGISKGAILCSLFCSSLYPFIVSLVHSDHHVEWRSLSFFHFWSSKDPQVISTWIFCCLLKCYTSQSFLHWCPDFSLPLELSELFNEITILLAAWRPYYHPWFYSSL